MNSGAVLRWGGKQESSEPLPSALLLLLLLLPLPLPLLLLRNTTLGELRKLLPDSAPAPLALIRLISSATRSKSRCKK